MLGPLTKMLCTYEPKEKDNARLRAEIELFLEQQADLPCALSHVTMDIYDGELHAIHNQPEDSNDLNIGQYVLTLGADPDHGVPMRALPLSYAADVWLWKSSEGNAKQHDLSQSVDECATFISHSWSDSWWIKASMLRNHLFLMEYDSVILVLGFVACTQALPMSFLLQNVATPVLSFLPLYIVLFSMAFASFRAHLSGVCIPSTWGPWPKQLDSENSVWLDKVCIDQTNMDTKQKGIANLALYLLRCRRMTIMLGETYFTRLWTTFELAAYCYVHQNNLAYRLEFLSFKWATTWNFLLMFRRVQLDKSEKDQLATYSCLDANCYLPADRMVVLAFIRKMWGSEEAFDEFVRTKLPEILRKGKEDFMWRSIRIMNSVLELLF
jgi:hypothetical protein